MNNASIIVAAALISWEKLVPFAVFGLFAVAAFWMLEVVAGRPTRVHERLDELKNPLARRRDVVAGKGKKGDTMSKVLEKASPVLSKPLQPKSEGETSKLRRKLSQAGFRGDGAATMFLGLKFAGLIAGLFLGGGGTLIAYGAGKNALMYTVCIAAFLFYLPDLVVWFMGRGRKQQIFLGLPDALDLLVVCVEAGLGLDQAMRKVAEEMKRTARVISEEFSLCNFHLQMGKARTEVLHDLGERTGVDDLRSLAAILIQADKFGSSVAQALRVQSDAMRTRRRQLAEEKAAKTAVKLIFPLVIFIFPGIFVVLVGPAAITMVREMFPVMGAR
ncbi:MAG: type II secretion system F family protein [Pirellulales bacterium]|nr:type II secretion system F family protein [Pirellulales bacterium]